MVALSRDVSRSHIATQATTLERAKGHAQMLSIAVAQANDQKAAQYFAIAMAGLIVLFSTLHWSRIIYNRCAPKRVRNTYIINALVMVSR